MGKPCCRLLHFNLGRALIVISTICWFNYIAYREYTRLNAHKIHVHVYTTMHFVNDTVKKHLKFI